ncbi:MULTISPECIES: ISAs1 family transposase [unclassified Streptomyces]|uniref:ISAs1 family transposase n=1 Tax=unclassified Streptomyces TaxID=2593676 RepID=UPI003873AA71
MPAASSSLTAAAPVTTPSPVDPAAVVPPGLLDALARVPDPRARRGRRFQLTTLLAVGVCAMTCAGHNSLVSIAEWARRCEQEVLARLGCPYDPFAGRYRAPGERTLRDAFARVDPAALTAAGFAHLTALATAPLAPVNPDGTREREQRRAHRTARRVRPGHQTIRRRAIAVDGKCLRGAVRADGSKVFVLSAVRHDDALTAALREIGAKTNEIPEFAPLLDQIADTDLTDAVVTVDALHAQTAHARYLVEQRKAHYLLSVKHNQPTLARQLAKLPWREIPIQDRSRDRGHGREEVREVKVASVDNLLFPHAKQVVRIHRKRRRLGTKWWSTETVYAVTDLAAHQADAAEIAAWARGHWMIESTVHWSKDVVFGEDLSQVRRHRTPVVVSVFRDLARAALHRAGWANIASGRRAHTRPEAILTLHGIP